jgi:alkylation response protein AidB-like acyl-CoA dehydrogenase
LSGLTRDFQGWGQRGLLGHAISTEHGGSGDGFAELAVAHERFGREVDDTGRVLALNAHVWGGLFPILIHGNETQRRAWLPGLLSGETVAGHAITEPQAGSDLHGLQARAVNVDAGFQLSGRKRYITNTPYADILVVYAQLEQGLSGFIVHRDDPGVAFLSEPGVTACQTAGMGDVLLEECLLPSNRLLGAAGNGLLMVQQALELERAFVFAGICGIMENLLTSVIRFCRIRKVREQPLAHKQAVSHRIADMRTRLDTARLWVRHCADLKDRGKGITLASSQTKLLAAENFLQITLDAVQIMGAAGLEQEAPAQRLVRDAMASRLFSGTSEVQKDIIAAMLGLGGGR